MTRNNFNSIAHLFVASLFVAVSAGSTNLFTQQSDTQNNQQASANTEKKEFRGKLMLNGKKLEFSSLEELETITQGLRADQGKKDKVIPNYVEMKAVDIAASRNFYETVFGFNFIDYGKDYPVASLSKRLAITILFRCESERRINCRQEVIMSERIVMRTGECLIAGGPPFTAAEPEVVIGELDGPVGTAIATLTGNQAAGHSKVFAIMNTDVQVRPVTLMVSKVTVKNSRYTNILMGTVQAAIANGVLDAVRAGDIPKEKANDLGIICSVWLNPGVSTDDNLDHKALFEIHRKAMTQAIHKAMNNEPSIDWLLEHQDEITHKYYERGLKGEI